MTKPSFRKTAKKNEFGTLVFISKFHFKCMFINMFMFINIVYKHILYKYKHVYKQCMFIIFEVDNQKTLFWCLIVRKTFTQLYTYMFIHTYFACIFRHMTKMTALKNPIEMLTRPDTDIFVLTLKI